MTAPSYAHRGSARPLLGETIGQCLDRVTATWPEREVLVSLPQDLRFTYRQFHRIVNQAARSFLRLGIRRGDRVAIWSINNYEWVVAQFATARIGAVLVNVNPAYRAHELEFVLQASRARALLLIDHFKSSNYLEMFYEVCPDAKKAEPGHLESWRFPHLRSVIFIGREHHPGMLTRRSFVELGGDLDQPLPPELEDELNLDDIINIQYTSGTTGFPKGVLLTHNNILNNADTVGQMLGLTPEDRVCVPVPFYHCFGMVISNLASVCHGAAIVIPAPVFDPAATLAAIQEERCTIVHGVPTMFTAMLEHPEFGRYDVTSLRGGIMAGAPCPVELMRKVMERMHMTGVQIAYGQTEASPATTITSPDDPLERRVDSVGRVMPHQELKVIDPDTGRTVPRGVQGELCFRGYMVMAGYDNNAEATAAAIDDRGWLHSGDLGTMDAEGYVRITGRIKDLVIRGGENVYPREIEEYLHTWEEVAEAQVVGVPDERYGEELLACLRLHEGWARTPPTPLELRERCRGHLAHFKVPRYWWVMDEFPLTVTGKVQKFKLREMAAREQKETGHLHGDAKALEAPQPVG